MDSCWSHAHSSLVGMLALTTFPCINAPCILAGTDAWKHTMQKCEHRVVHTLKNINDANTVLASWTKPPCVTHQAQRPSLRARK